MAWNDGNWIGPIRVSDANSHGWKEIAAMIERPRGVYRLIALHAETDFTPEPLQRVCGDSDKSGTLYIGAANGNSAETPLVNRIGQLTATLARGTNYRNTPHRPLSLRLTERFPANRLGICWEYTDGEPWDREKRLLNLYEMEFGELPPNNGQR